MKKLCSAKETKVATTLDGDVLNEIEEGVKEQLTEEQLLINQKLREGGIDDEGLGWLEKRNIFKTINVSLGTAGGGKYLRTSPRFSKAINVKPEKWVENSFEIIKSEAVQNEKNLKTKVNKKDLDFTSAKKPNCVPVNKRPLQECEDSVLKSSPKIETSNTAGKNGSVKQTFSKSSKKVHYIKIEIEGNSEEAASQTSGDTAVSLGKKRASTPDKKPETPKKLKMEEANNGTSLEEEISLKVELDMEKLKQNSPFKLRDIKTIVSECEIRNQKWKETFLKYKSPTRWGMPIVKNGSEKWDGKFIPPKLLHRFQKYLSSNNLTHPVFLPVKSQSCSDIKKLSNSETSGCIDCQDEPEGDLDEESFIHNESSGPGIENNLNSSFSSKENGERMVLRNRNQQKVVSYDEEDFSSDDSEDWLVKQKSSKKQRGKSKKIVEQSNKQLVLKLEKCNINRGNENEGGRRNGNKNDIGFSGESIVIYNNSFNQASGLAESGPDPDTMVCPICSLRFKKQLIESHATECASKTYKD